MKNRPLFPLFRLLCAACLATTVLTRSSADEAGTTAKVTLSAPGQPATLRVDMPWADIQIVGVDGDTVTVETTLAEKGADSTRSDGLRRLDDEVSFELTEKANVVSLRLAGENPWAGHDAEFRISVPRAMALDIKTEAGGDLKVKDLTGDIDINNMNGEVSLEGITGSTVVNTMNGEVRAVFASAPQKLVSITSMNGAVDLRVPADTKANIRLRTHNGSILTDFSETVLKTKTEGKSGGYNSQAAMVAGDAVRQAIQIAREVTYEVQREIEIAMKEAAEAEAEAQAVQQQAAEEADSAATAKAPAPPAPKSAAPRPPRAPRPPMPPITGGKTVSGTLNGGGVDIKVSTMNGEITLRQTK
jgi:Putative adhesin